MPTYEFRCPKGHEFEKFFKTMSTAKMELPCPTCGSVAARQLSAGGGLVFKGSGFYLTDYGTNAHRGEKKDGKPKEGATTESAKSESKGESAKSDSATAAPKADAKPSAEKPKAETPKSESRKPKAE